MSSYIHHIPGRLRIRTRRIAEKPHLCRRVQILLENSAGVLSATPNCLTGSIVVTFDPDVVTSDHILHILEHAGFFDPATARTTDERIERAAQRAGEKVGKAVLGWAVKRAVAGTPLALLAEVI